MNEDVLAYLFDGIVATNAGSTAKEFFLEQAENEYNNGNISHSIFYQVRTLFQAFQDRYYQIVKPAEVSAFSETECLLANMHNNKSENIENNELMQYALKVLRQLPADDEKHSTENFDCVSSNFLKDITESAKGIQKIRDICSELPKEWTVLQLCKGGRSDTSYSTFPQIHQRDAGIYIALLRHARSSEYPEPICIRFTKPEQTELFKKFALITNHFKQCINVNPKNYTTKEAKQQYWSTLDELNKFIAATLTDLQNFLYPWKFLFTGQPRTKSTTSQSTYQRNAFACVDDFCNAHAWENSERVLLSLAALHVTALNELEIHSICQALSKQREEQAGALKMLLKLQTLAKQHSTEQANANGAFVSKHLPCILVVDERLDHIFWEELNVQQEFCRVNSLQCLYRLYQLHKTRIKRGYLTVNINQGGCVVNPDDNLPKTELRMRRFFEYWTPHWLMQFTERPTQEQLFNDYFKRPCYVYAGHGSGLQYINGKHIAKQRIEGVVFLFGCDSSRLHSNGLYSELVGPHLYYHAAMCPTLVGTLMPALDANMDSIAAEILSRWIAPNSLHVLPWNEINRNAWVKEGLIKPAKTPTTDNSPPPSIANTSDYQMGSLCAIVSRVHQRLSEPKYYNTVAYVCRGLPVWNCNVQPLPP